MTPERHVRPRDCEEVVDLVRAAGAQRATVSLEGAGSKIGWGHPVQASWSVRMDAIAGIVCYEPEELVLTVRPGTPLTEIDALLARHGQMLAFEPPDFGPLWGQAPARATIGGTVACNASGPRRLRAGAVRDHLLGAQLVNGRAEVIRTGGRVVKNVTGYDLCKLLAGSFGTLGILTELTLKLLPRPRSSASLAVRALDAVAATRAMAELTSGSGEPSALGFLPPGVVMSGQAPGETLLLARFEGSRDGVAERIAATRRRFGGDVLEQEESIAAWEWIRDAAPFRGAGALWRLAIAPSALAAVAAALEQERACRWLADWGGSLIWACIDDDAGAVDVRALAQRVGGRATSFRSPSDAGTAIWSPPQPAVAALNARIKAGFDPLGIFNPGRLGG